jgi:hypothetical protein
LTVPINNVDGLKQPIIPTFRFGTTVAMGVMGVLDWLAARRQGLHVYGHKTYPEISVGGDRGQTFSGVPDGFSNGHWG